MKKTFFLALALLMSLSVRAQFNVADLFSSSNQQLVELAVRGGVFVIVQQYQLKDTVSGEYFGRGGRQEFGTTLSLGVKVRGGYIYTDIAERPWEHDGNFGRYRQTHRPVIYKTEMRELTDSIPTERTGYYKRETLTLVDDLLYAACDSISFAEEGFLIDHSPLGVKEGWVVWLTSTKGGPEASVADTISYVIHRKTIELQAGANAYDIESPTTEQQVWGGLMVCPEQSVVGQLTFRLVGVMIKSNEAWKLISVVSLTTLGIDGETSPFQGPDGIDDELTPVVGSENPAPTPEGKKKGKKKAKTDQA